MTLLKSPLKERKQTNKLQASEPISELKKHLISTW